MISSASRKSATRRAIGPWQLVIWNAIGSGQGWVTAPLATRPRDGRTGECVGRDPGLSDALYGLLKLCAPFHPKMSSLLGAFLELGDDLGKDTTRDWAQISAATIQSTYEQIEKVKETCSTLGNLSKSTLRGR
jgi:hypothetical protein